MSDVRTLINKAVAELDEAWKWDTAVWVRGKANVCAVGAFKDHIKINFFDGASVADPKRLFSSGLEAKRSRSLELQRGDKLDRAAFSALVRAAAGTA